MVKQNSSKKSIVELDKVTKENNLVLTLTYLRYLLFIIWVIIIIINILAIQWIYKLEEISCKCSEDWKRDYIKYFLIVFIIISIFKFISYLLFGKYIDKKSTIFGIIFFIFRLFSFANVIISIMYINDLKNIKCECSEDTRREIYYYYKIISIVIICISILVDLFFMGVLAYIYLNYTPLDI